MKWIRERALNRELLSGTWLNLGSSMTAEIVANAGFDWVVVDLEHGAGGHDMCLHQLQAIAGAPTAPIVRVAWNEAPRVKRVLDLGASGVVVPYVTTAGEAEQAVAAMRYPPHGVRGAASLTRAADFGASIDDYLSTASHKLLTVVQIETPGTLDVVDDIAAVDGVDVLFIGPLDLSLSMGIPQQFDHPQFLDALARVSRAAESHGKAAGILLNTADHIERTIDAGFTFVGLGSDGSALAESMRSMAGAFGPHR
jgi:4-hydroxy-2-oxoheptanedioate aldolase